MASPAELTRRVLNGSPLLRAVADTEVAQQVIQTYRATRILSPAGRFTLKQARRGTVGTYRLRHGGHTVHLRHGTRDVDILAEIFMSGSYEPPAALAPAFQRPLRIIDLGGNIGLFGLFALSRWDVVSMRSYEPDPDNIQLLRVTAAVDRVWEVIEAAVSNAVGTMRFVTGQFSESREATPGEKDAIDVPVIDLFAEADAHVLKMDIEGGEWPILTDPRLHDLHAHAVVVEWHCRQCPQPDPRAYASQLLADAGFVNQHQEPGRFDSNGLLWAWR
jgi:FkbM family methyltransferase